MNRALLFAAVALTACSSKSGDGIDASVADMAVPVMRPPDLSLTCAGAVASVRLVESYCDAGEADRCFYTQPPMNGY